MSTSARGYTLLELIVSLGIFSMVMLAATSAYLSLVNLDRQARATADVVTNLSFAVDSMTREVRTGIGYKCNNSSGTPNCPSSPGTSFGFTDSNGRTVVYSVANHQLMETVNGVTSPLTDPRVSITTLAFYVRGVGTNIGDGTAEVQPQALFIIQGTLQTQNKAVSFSLEGAATERYLDL